MPVLKHTLQILSAAFLFPTAGLLLTACSGQSAEKPEQIMEAEAPAEKETEAVPAEETFTMHEFVSRWNELDPGGLSAETETYGVENGIITEMGSLGFSDSYVVELDQTNKHIRHVSLNLTYPLPEEEQVSAAIIHKIRVLIDVLEPELEDKERDKIIETLGVTKDYSIAEASARMSKVTYTINNEDDRPWVDAAFPE